MVLGTVCSEHYAMYVDQSRIVRFKVRVPRAILRVKPRVSSIGQPYRRARHRTRINIILLSNTCTRRWLTKSTGIGIDTKSVTETQVFCGTSKLGQLGRPSQRLKCRNRFTRNCFRDVLCHQRSRIPNRCIRQVLCHTVVLCVRDEMF